jgi:nucleotide-binding universal stress UspA family protein
MDILLCTNSPSSDQPALEYGMWLAKLLGYPVVLLGIVEKRGIGRDIEELIDATSRQMVDQGISCRSLIVPGSAEGVIARGAARGEYLTIVGSLRRSRWQRFWRGSSFRRLMDSIESPLLYVPSAHLQLRRILLCTGGLHYARGVTDIVGRIAQALHAKVTLLHVTEPASLHYPPADELQDDQQDILVSSTPQALHVQHTLSEFDRAGIPAELKHRRGYIVREIIAEVRSTDYDMVGLGSPYGMRTLRHLFTPNVTAEVQEALSIPMLVARYGQGMQEVPR